ncbi:hypothetical protein D046_7175A, partial [Vibrio parahaemolyticus V-223/04]|jgi:protein disulfide-isomerase-like protein
MKKQ